MEFSDTHNFISNSKLKYISITELTLEIVPITLLIRMSVSGLLSVSNKTFLKTPKLYYRKMGIHTSIGKNLKAVSSVNNRILATTCF